MQKTTITTIFLALLLVMGVPYVNALNAEDYDFHYTFTFTETSANATYFTLPMSTNRPYNITVLANMTQWAENGVHIDLMNTTVQEDTINGGFYDVFIDQAIVSANDEEYEESCTNHTVRFKYYNSTYNCSVTSPNGPESWVVVDEYLKYVHVYRGVYNMLGKVDVWVSFPAITATEQTTYLMLMLLPALVVLKLIQRMRK